MSEDYDLVINNGRVMDPETMHDSIANVGVKDGRIAVITQKDIKGKETIDATAHEFARSEVLGGFTGGQDARSGVVSRGAGTGWSSRRPTLEEGNRILQLLDKGMMDGAPGVGSTVGYMRDGVSTREFFEIHRLANLYGRQLGAHFRYTPGTDTTESNGIQEPQDNGRFEPITEANWEKTFYASPVDFGGGVPDTQSH